MEDKSFDKIFNAVRILIRDNKIHSAKILELEKKIDKNEEVSKRVEKAINDEKEQIDKRFDSAIDRFDNFDKIVEEHIENIGEIESKSLDITNKIDSINESLKKINDEIIELENKRVTNMEISDDIYVAETSEIRQCRFDRSGFCRKETNDCNFLHVNESCDIYLKKGYCNRTRCIKRHPKKCFYFERGYCKRNEVCRYYHRKGLEMKECDNCENKSQVTYYCEFCEKSFCNACTVEEAHATNPDKSNQLTECKFIHL